MPPPDSGPKYAVTVTDKDGNTAGLTRADLAALTRAARELRRQHEARATLDQPDPVIAGAKPERTRK